MTTQESSLRARLMSQISASMVHTATSVLEFLPADLTAIRLVESRFRISPQANDVRIEKKLESERYAYVHYMKLRLPTATVELLQDWPFTGESIFDHVTRRNTRDSIFRPRELIAGPEVVDKPFSRAITGHADVVDSCCVTFPLAGSIWAILVLVRVSPANVFSAGDTLLLQRIKPALTAGLLKATLESFGNGNGAQYRTVLVESSRGQNGSIATAGLKNRIAGLSRKEYEIFQLLRTDATERRIAAELQRSPHTIHVHVKNIYRKLDVRSRLQLRSLVE